MNINDDSIYQMAQWVIVGRLTASLFHEINNPLQAIRGAMSLALEDLEDISTLRTYLELGVTESDRVISLIARARQIYSQENTEVTPTDINNVLREMVVLTTKEMVNKKIKIDMQLAANLPLLDIVFNKILLALLCPILEISDLMVGGGMIKIRTVATADFVCVEMFPEGKNFVSKTYQLPVCRRIVGEYKGSIRQKIRDEQNILQIALPT